MHADSQRTTEEFERIDAIRSVTAIKEALRKLHHGLRRDVILLGLAKSRFQFTWSHFANKFEVPEAEWPPQPEHSKRP